MSEEIKSGEATFYCAKHGMLPCVCFDARAGERRDMCPYAEGVTFKELAETVAYNAGFSEGSIAKQRAVAQIKRDLREAYDAGRAAGLEEAAKEIEFLEPGITCSERRKPACAIRALIRKEPQ